MIKKTEDILAVSQNFEKPLLASFKSVFLSIRTNQLGSHATDFHEIWYLNIFSNSVQKIQVSLNSYKNIR